MVNHWIDGLNNDLCHPCPYPENYHPQKMKGFEMTRESLLEMYFDYVNNYLTIEKFAEHRGLYVDEALILIDLAKRCLAAPHPES